MSTAMETSGMTTENEVVAKARRRRGAAGASAAHARARDEAGSCGLWRRIGLAGRPARAILHRVRGALRAQGTRDRRTRRNHRELLGDWSPREGGERPRLTAGPSFLIPGPPIRQRSRSPGPPSRLSAPMGGPPSPALHAARPLAGKQL